MYNHLHFYGFYEQFIAVALPFEAESIIEEWHNLRKIMVRNAPAEFTRDEWAYLISFLDKGNLQKPFARSFGKNVVDPSDAITYLFRPRGAVSVWLPNNVTLLGPLMLVLLSLSGNALRMKSSSQSENVTLAFYQYALNYLQQGQLKELLERQVTIESFGRSDLRNREMAAGSKIRIVFGSDETVMAIDTMPHPADSIGIHFMDRQSEAWVDKGALGDQAVETLIKVFAIYGQAGCTSPRKVVIIGGDRDDAVNLRNRIVSLWPKVITRVPSQHVSSSNIMAYQWAMALGWDAALTKMNGAVIAAGPAGTPVFTSLMSLPIVWSSLEEAAKSLPGNIQTIGHSFQDAKALDLLTIIAGTKVKRFVPISSMHHFGHVWDGYSFWRQLFEEVEVSL